MTSDLEAPHKADSQPTVRNTIVLQALAAISIANSHLEPLYPQRWMAADGLLGNAMFFLLSGYGLMSSEQKSQRSFVTYYLRRVLRIYPALLLVVVAFQVLLGGQWRTWTATDYLKFLIYPTEFGYVQQIMVYYIVFFFLARMRQARVFPMLMLALCLPYGWFYWCDIRSSQTGGLLLGNLNPWMWRIFFFQVMLLGGWLASDDSAKRLSFLKYGRSLLGICFGGYIAFKFAMVKGISTPWGPLFNFYAVLHVLTLAILVLAFVVFTEPRFLAAVTRPRPLAWGVALVGGLTLEIYLVHGFVLAQPSVAGLIFPLNVAVFFVITILLSHVLAAAIKHGRRLVESWILKS